MQRLIYTLERIPTAHNAQPAVDDAVVGITMAALGVHGIQKEIGGSAHSPRIRVTFPDEKTLLAFNLRIERALNVRGVKIKRIEVDAQQVASGQARAVA